MNAATDIPTAPPLSSLWRQLAAGTEAGAACSTAEWQARLDSSACHPAPQDRALWRLALAFGLPLRDTLLLALALWPELDDAAPGAPSLRQAAAWLAPLQVRQGPQAAAWAASPLFTLGWLLPGAGSGTALADRLLQLPALLALALQGQARLPAGWHTPQPDLPLPPGWARLARHTAGLLAESAAATTPALRGQVLVLRHADRAEALAWLSAVAARLGHRLAVRDERPGTAGPATDELPTGALPPWLWLTRSLWVLDALDTDAPRLTVPPLPGYQAPVFVLAPASLAVEATGRDLLELTLALPPVAERAALWSWALAVDTPARQADGPQALHPRAELLARQHRLGPSAIRQAAVAWSQALAREPGGPADAAQRPAADPAGGVESEAPPSPAPRALPPWQRPGASADLQGLAHWRQPAAVAPVLPTAVQAQFELLHARCLQRDTLPAHLSAAAAARTGAGVRALLHGASGTGKTLAAEWLAARLGKLLLVVDTAAVTSKYIGETERHLDRVMSGAERLDAVLLFDEADALFARRTEVGSSNDRFANAQTNFLLQRLEAHGGITLLTSNGRSRIDSAFTRRLDAVIEFAPPSPHERLALWRALLGATASSLPAGFMERLALDVEAAGGTLRNIVSTATVLAGGPPREAELEVACALECAKSGQPAPAWAVAAQERWLQEGAPIALPKGAAR